MFTVLLEGVVLGGLAAVVLIYALQTRVLYPLWMLQTYDHPWILLVLFVVSILVFQVHPRIGAYLILVTLAILVDGLLFVRHLEKEQPRTWTAQDLVVPMKPKEVWPFDAPSLARDEDAAGPSLASIPLPQPEYPSFYGMEDQAYGPAPFV
jgi:hypothetical protein